MFAISSNNLSSPIALLAAIFVFALSFSGCGRALRKGSVTPQEVCEECLFPPRDLRVPIDYRYLEGPQPDEHYVDSEDVLGIYVADIIGEREELPNVAYPSFRQTGAPIEPFVGHPITVETDGTIHLPYVEKIFVRNMSLSQVRDAIREAYSVQRSFIAEDRENIQVTLITPRSHRVHIFRQDTRYNVPGLQQTTQFEISRRWAGSTLFLEPKDASVLSALLRTGGLPGIDARNEIWVMKGLSQDEVNEIHETPIETNLKGNLPMMLAKHDSKLIRIPLRHPAGSPLPFDLKDTLLGDGDVVFLPKREGDHFLTGGLLPPGRIPLERDRDIDVIEAIAKATGSTLGAPGGFRSPIQFNGGPGNVFAPTELIVVRRTEADVQYKIRVDLQKAMDDPSERLRIIPGDLLVLRYRPHELAGNILLNLFDFGFNFNQGTNVLQ